MDRSTTIAPAVSPLPHLKPSAFNLSSSTVQQCSAVYFYPRTVPSRLRVFVVQFPASFPKKWRFRPAAAALCPIGQRATVRCGSKTFNVQLAPCNQDAYVKEHRSQSDRSSTQKGQLTRDIIKIKKGEVCAGRFGRRLKNGNLKFLQYPINYPLMPISRSSQCTNSIGALKILHHSKKRIFRDV